MNDEDKELLINTIQLLLSWLPDCGRNKLMTENWYDLNYGTRVEIKEARRLAEKVLRSYGVEPLFTERK
jgi:hypothetical protein